MPAPNTSVNPESPRVVSARVAAQMIASSTAVLVVDARDGDAQYRERVKGSINSPSLCALNAMYPCTVLVYDSGTTTLVGSSTPANRELSRLHAYGLPHLTLCLVQGGLPALRVVAPHFVLPPAALPPHLAHIPWARTAFRELHAQYAAPAEVLPALFVGAAVHASDPQWLLERKVTHILAVGEEFNPPLFKHPTLFWSRIPVKDHPSEKLAPFFTDAIRFINDARKIKGIVLVHCLAGASRSVATVAAYLIYFGWSLDQALTHMKALRFAANPNPGFLSQLRHWETVCSNDTRSDNSDSDAIQKVTFNSLSSDMSCTSEAVSLIPVSPITPSTDKSTSVCRTRHSPSREQLQKCRGSFPALEARHSDEVACKHTNANEMDYDSEYSEDEDSELLPRSAYLVQ